MRKSSYRKEARIKDVLAKRGDHAGLVHVLSAMEACPSYRPWYDKQTGKTHFDASKVSRLLKRRRVHGLIKRIGRTYKYYLTALGRRALLAGLHIRTMVLPQMLTAEN
jgi:hypothetical protein